MLTADDLAAIRDRAEKATPGAWDYDTVDVPDVYFSDGNERHGYQSYVVYVDTPDGKTIVDAANSNGGTIEEEHDEYGVYAWDETARRNAAFIAAARSDIPALLVEVDRLAGELARVTAMLSDVSAQRETYRVDLIIARKRISELERETEQLATAYRNL
jgi:chromosome segregation ATPase